MILATRVLLSSLYIFFLLGPSGCSNQPDIKAEKFSYLIVNSFPHDPMAFTQGLAWDQGIVYEGTGQLGKSSLRKVELQTGKIEQKIDNAEDIFGEGITVYQNKIYQLTWKNKTAFVYDKSGFTLIKSYHYPRQGWGITNDAKNLIVSDGTATLYFLNPETLTEQRNIKVHDNSEDIKYLNELEYIKGKIYANIWNSDKIAIINPNDGRVEGWIDLSGLREQLVSDQKIDVLNGIMYDKEESRLFVTGKFWPTLFEIKLIPVKR